MTTINASKALIGTEDLSLGLGTFARTTSTGGSQTMTKFNTSTFLEGVYNVKDYGAIGDNSADDTVAIQDAIDAADAAGGGRVHFPAGSYKITSRITQDDQVVCSGSGSENTRIRAGIAFSDGSDIMWELGKASGDAFSCYVEDMEFDGNSLDPITCVYSHLIQSGSGVRRCTFRNYTLAAVWVNNQDAAATIAKNYFLEDILCVPADSTQSITYGLRLNGYTGSVATAGFGVSRLTVDASAVGATPDVYGLSVDGVSAGVMSNIEVINCEYGVRLGVTNVVKSCVVQGVTGTSVDTFLVEVGANAGDSNLLMGLELVSGGGDIIRDSIEGVTYSDPTVDIFVCTVSGETFIGGLEPGSRIVQKSKSIAPTLTANAFSARDGNVFQLLTSVDTLSDITDGKLGQVIEVIFLNDNITVDFSGSSTLKGNLGVDWNPQTNDVLRCVSTNGSIWVCTPIRAEAHFATVAIATTIVLPDDRLPGDMISVSGAGPVTITDMTPKQANDSVTIRFLSGGVNILTDNSNIAITGGTLNPIPGDTIMSFKCDGTTWFETSRVDVAA